MIRRDENITKGVGHEMQLTFMDANRPEFWLKGKVAKGYTVYPLYTHPHSEKSVKVKELTDEEILKLEEIEFENYCVDKESRGRKTATITDPEWAIWFARAILRKAQEK